ncbi:MAG TPA: hypothetical protein VH115_02485, partial [Solirubrobacteraceae bacterium]|nr:hypothetical protein [Solirubrobacteraceae bacterium]
MPPLSIMLWLPAASGVLGALLSLVLRRSGVAKDASTGEPLEGPLISVAGASAVLGALATLGLAIGYIADYSPGSGLRHVTDVVWIGELGIHYKLGVDGLTVFLVGLAALLFAAAAIAANLRRWERPRFFYAT